MVKSILIPVNLCLLWLGKQVHEVRGRDYPVTTSLATCLYEFLINYYSYFSYIIQMGLSMDNLCFVHVSNFIYSNQMILNALSVTHAMKVILCRDISKFEAFGP